MESRIGPPTRLRIAICGGGIGGLCLAVSLTPYSHLDVQLYESAGQFKEIGAGVMIWARTWRILEQMGLADEFSKIAHSPPTGEQGVGFDFRRSDAPQEGFRFKLVDMPFQSLKYSPFFLPDGCIRFHRAEFLDIFVNHLPPGIAHFGKKLVSYSKDPETLSTRLHFADGTSTTCDVLVGADGIKSCIRSQMFQEAADFTQDPSFLRYVSPIWTGTMAYRGLIRVQDMPITGRGSLHRAIQEPVMYCGKGKHVVSYSISKGDIVNVVTFASNPEKHGNPYNDEWVVECEQGELLQCYSGWEPEVGELLECIKKPTRWAIHHILPLPFYHRNGVVLIGDAAHAMSPHQGAGSGQAIEDAYILSHLLPKASPDTLDQFLNAYQKVRLPSANRVLSGSYESGMMYEFNSDFGDDYERLGPAIQHMWDWIDDPPLEKSLEMALSWSIKRPTS